MKSTEPLFNLQKITRTLFFLFFFICIVNTAYTQPKFRIASISERLISEDTLYKQSTGIYVEYYFLKHVSISYQFSIGNTSSDHVYAHVSVGSYAATFPLRWYAQSGDDAYKYLTIICILIPESINFHILLGEHLDISPFVSPLGLSFEKIKGVDVIKSSLGAGVRFHADFNNWHITPYVLTRRLYDDNEAKWFFGAGLMLGLRF
jgi:hypothetical protein